METTRVAIIMAGGSGERFWPLSRRLHPKQLLRLTRPDMSLLQEAVARLRGVVDPEHIFVATGRHLKQTILDAGGLGIPDENVVAEPCKRNTAGCLCYVAAVLARRYADTPPEQLAIAVLTADHAIGDEERFRNCLDTALNAAVDSASLVTIGIRPSRVETGYGHIEISPENAAQMAAGIQALPVVRFREKPDREAAERFFESGRFLWNSGMFFWTLATFLRELGDARPAMAQTVAAMTRAMHDDDETAVETLFAGLDSISIDYALLEKAQRVLVVPATFTWDDIGAWDALQRTFPEDEAGNVQVGDSVLVDCSDTIVYNATDDGGMAVATIGLEGLVVVVAKDAVLVVPKARAQEVKQAVKELRERKAPQL